MNPVTNLPVIIDDKCVACGACVKACPRLLIELRKKAKKDRKIYVACSNCDKGGPARRACKVACIACGKCVKVCEFGAITIKNNLAYIDARKCTFCRKCVSECPTGSIIELNFPQKKSKTETQPEVAGNLTDFNNI
jgi:ferredoxin